MAVEKRRKAEIRSPHLQRTRFHSKSESGAQKKKFYCLVCEMLAEAFRIMLWLLSAAAAAVTNYAVFEYHEKYLLKLARWKLGTVASIIRLTVWPEIPCRLQIAMKFHSFSGRIFFSTDFEIIDSVLKWAIEVLTFLTCTLLQIF